MAANTNNRQFGRAMGLLGAVAFIATLYAKLFIIPEFTNPAILVQGAIAVLALGIYLATNFRGLGDQFSGRGTLFLTTTAISAALLAGALGAANYIVVKKPKTWDLTKDQIFTLSDQTVGTLKGLTTEVTVTGFYGTGDPEFGELFKKVAAP